jgi:circadian clock protein KaiC
MGWDIEALERSGRFFLWEAKIDRSAVTSGEFTIDSLLAVIKGKADQIGARTIMIDAVDVLMRIFEDSVKERNELYRLHDWLVEQRFTTILTAKVTKELQYAYRYEFLDYMADCVILLDMRVTNQVTTRRLRVVKYRGSAFCSNEYPYIITTGGNVIMPITAMQLVHRPTGNKISSGNEDLDNLLTGGFQQGFSILISGPTGSGKTTLAATFAQKACSLGDNVLYISFEESQDAIVAAMLSPGINLRPCLRQGKLEFYTIMPEALVPEEHLYCILQKTEQIQPMHIIIDAISACIRMSTEEAAFNFVVRLIDACRQRNITIIMTNQLEADGRHSKFSGIGVSSIIDTLITFKYVEIERKMRRSLIVMKSRGTHHSEWHHWYLITDEGIRIDPVQTDTGGSQ